MVIKRLFAVAVTICLLCGTCASAAADNTLIIGENVIFDLKSYGILQGSETGELELDRNVTRAEFCAFVARLIGTERLPYANEFKDVSESAWYAQDVSTLVIYGLISGNEHGEFRPNDSITCIEAIKILVCALGYEKQAVKAGGYPVGYQQMGIKLKLNNGVSAQPNDYLTRGAVALMLYNALDVEIMEQKLFGKDVTYELSGKTFRSLFSSNNKSEPVHMATGIVTANYYTFLLAPISNMALGEVEINGTIYNEGNTNTADFIGLEVEYYYKETDSGRPIILGSRPSRRNEIVTVDSEDIGNIDSNTLNYYDSEKHKNIHARLSDSFGVVKNYQIVMKPYTFTSGSDICKNGFVRLIDNTGDGVYDLAVVEDYNSYRIGKTSENGLFIANDGTFDGRRFVETDTDDDKVKVILENGAGEKISLSDIEEDDVVSFLQSEDKSVLKCVKGLEPVSGYLTETDDEGRICIDGEYYELDYYYQNDAKIGDLVTAYPDFRGRIVELEKDKSSGKSYAYILDSGFDKGLNGDFRLKVLIPGKLKPQVEIDDSDENQIVEVPVLKAYNDKVEILTAAERISVEGEKMGAEEYSRIFAAANLNAVPDNRLISYKTNSEGEIKSIEYVTRIGNGGYKVYNAYENVFGKEGTEPFGITEESSVICVPPEITEDFDDDNYYASLLMNNGQRYEITGYDIEPEDSVANIVVITANMDLNVGDVINGKSKLAVLSKKEVVIDKDNNEEKTRLEFYSEGKRMTYFVSEDSDAAEIARNMRFGDAFYYALNNVDEIYRLSICELGHLGKKLIFGDRGSNDTERSILGKVTDIDYNIIDIYENRRVNRLTVMIDEETDIRTSYDVNRRNTPPVYVVDTEKKDVRVGSIDDIYAGGDAVFAHIKEYSLKGIVIIQ